MKIIIPLVGGFGKTGGWRVLSQLANFWIENGEEVVFLAHKKTDKPYFPTKAEIIYYDNKGIINQHSDESYKAPALGALSLRKSLKKALDKMEADIVLATHSFTAEPVKKSSVKAKKFYYIQAYEPEYYYKKNIKDKLYKLISRRSYKLGLLEIVNAPMYMNYNEIQTDMYVFPGLDLDNFKSVSKSRSTKITLGTIGRLEEYKGTTYIVQAFKELRKEFGNNIELHMAFGDPSLSNEEGIILSTPGNDKELADYYNSLNIYICAGTVQLQAVHYPVIEAMACKIPVITTGYLPSDDSNSWIIPIKNSEAIKNKVKELIKNGTFEKVEKGYKDVQVFRWQNVSAKMLNYFKSK